MFRVIPYQSVYSVFLIRNAGIPRDSAIPRNPCSNASCFSLRRSGF